MKQTSSSITLQVLQYATLKKEIKAACCGFIVGGAIINPALADESSLSASLVIDTSYFSVAGQSEHNATRGLLDISWEHSIDNWTMFANGQARANG